MANSSDWDFEYNKKKLVEKRVWSSRDEIIDSPLSLNKYVPFHTYFSQQ